MALLGDPQDFVWVDLVNPTRPELAVIATIFDLEALQIEDASNPHQRAKFDVDDAGSAFALFKVLDYEEETSGVSTGQIAVFVGPGYAVTIRQGGSRDISGVRSRIEESDALRGHGSIAVMYAVLDFVVDGYLAVMDEVGSDVDEIETQVFASIPVSRLTRRIYDLKRENMEARRAVAPLVSAAHHFASESAPEVPDDLRPYFRDIGEHILRVDESVDSIDNLLLTMLMASTALQDLQQNKDMRKISAYAAMGVVPAVIAGIYGMNFKHMPELDWEFGYPLALGLMGLIVALLYRAFKKSGWL
jgi:magnesium transporter